MTKDHQERPCRICDSLSIIIRQGEPRHKIQKHHDLGLCPTCRYRNKATQFRKHLKKARGLRATAEARRAEKRKKKTAALVDGLEKLATVDAPTPSIPPTPQAHGPSIAQPQDDPACSIPDKVVSLPPVKSTQLPQTNLPAIHYTQDHESLSELPLNEEQRSRRSSDALSYISPITSASSGYINVDGSVGDCDSRGPKSSPSRDKPCEERSLKPSFLPKDSDLDLDLDLDCSWDLGFSQYTKGQMRLAFESNQGLYDASLAYLLNFNPIAH